MGNGDDMDIEEWNDSDDQNAKPDAKNTEKTSETEDNLEEKDKTEDSSVAMEIEPTDDEAQKVKEFLNETNNVDTTTQNENDEKEAAVVEPVEPETTTVEKDGMLIDRIDDIIFCCFDIGNWKLYQQATPQMFVAQNKQHSYLWTDKVESRKKAKGKQNSRQKGSKRKGGGSQTNQNKKAKK